MSDDYDDINRPMQQDGGELVEDSDVVENKDDEELREGHQAGFDPQALGKVEAVVHDQQVPSDDRAQQDAQTDSGALNSTGRGQSQPGHRSLDVNVTTNNQVVNFREGQHVHCGGQGGLDAQGFDGNQNGFQAADDGQLYNDDFEDDNEDEDRDEFQDSDQASSNDDYDSVMSNNSQEHDDLQAEEGGSSDLKEEDQVRKDRNKEEEMETNPNSRLPLAMVATKIRQCSKESAVALSPWLNTEEGRTFKDSKGNSLVHLAVIFGNVKCLRLLLSQDSGSADMEAEGEFGNPLETAVRKKKPTCLQLLLDFDNSNVNKSYEDGTLLMKLCDERMFSAEADLRMISILLQHGADPNIRGRGGELPLYRACCLPNELGSKVVSMLLPLSKYDPEKDDKGFSTPFHFAILRNLRSLEVLIELTSKQEFVRIHRHFEDFLGKVTLEPNNRIGEMSGLSLMLDLANKSDPLLIHLASKMIDLGWDVNGDSVLTSPLAVLLRNSQRFDYRNSKLIFWQLVELLTVRGAKVTPHEVGDLFLNFNGLKNGLIRNLLKRGILNPEALLQGFQALDGSIGHVVHAEALLKAARIINDVFGNQGQYAEKIQLYITTAAERPPQNGMDPMDQLTTDELKLGTLKQQSRAIVRQCILSSNGGFMLAEKMKASLAQLMPAILVDYVASIDTLGWAVEDYFV